MAYFEHQITRREGETTIHTGNVGNWDFQVLIYGLFVVGLADKEDSAFRSRLKLADSVAAIIAAQDEYSQALVQFKAIAAEFPQGLDFEPSELGLKNQVIILDSGKVDLLYRVATPVPRNSPSHLPLYPASNW